MPVSIQSKICFSRRRTALFLTAATSALLALPDVAFAQNRTPAVYNNVDENGVDLVLGTFEQAFNGLSIGSGAGALTYGFSTAKGVWGANSFTGGVEVVGAMATVYIGGDMERFTISGTTYTSQQGEGSTLTLAGGLYTYMRDDGTIIMFDQSKWPVAGTANALPISIKTPEGSAINIYYKTVGTVARIQSVTNNRGYQLKYNYPSASSPMVSGVTAINNAVDYCDPTADACAGLTQSWPTMTVSTSSGAMTGANVYTITDAASRTSRFTLDGATRLTGIKRPSSASDNVTVSYGPSGAVASVTANGVTHTYNYSVTNNIATMIRTNPFGATVTAVSNLSVGRPSSVTNERSATTSYSYDPNGRLTQVVYPEGNAVQYSYDARGNVTTTTNIAKGASVPNIVTSATYPATCDNPRTCNSPVTTTDAKTNVTNYSYDATTGVTTSITAPAAVANGVRPQTRLSYANVQAYYKNSSGAIVASGQPIMVPTGSATCQTLSVCAGNADEVKTVISYGAQTAGVANNLLPVSASSGSGDGALTSSASVTYDIIGNRITVDGPLAGSADTVRTRYNAVRQVIGVVSPDPDGAGPLRHRAQRVGYNVDGLPVLTEVGTVASQSDADWLGFVSLQQSSSVYDANARLSRESVTAGGTIYSVVDYSYDALGRSDCVAQRLNPAVWGTLSAACTAQGAGSSGPDRIARTLYDEVGRVREVQTALGTGAAQNVLQSYNPNGTLETLTDGRGNKTTYAYDGFDRLVSTRFPSPVSVGVSSATDFEALTYDANSNVTVRRVRDGNLISYSYDALDRVTVKDVPTLAYEERDVSYTYDLLGRLKSATKADGFASNISYDALGRKLSETNGLGAIYFAYDSAGRRTQLTHGDGFYVTYEYLVSGETLAIRESGAAALGTYAYDDLGRRTSLTRGNGSVTTYSYDPASRLTSLGHDFADAAHDVTSSFTYTAASQIGSRSRSNDLYAFTAAVAGSRAYINNGLNQHSSAAGTAQSYDGRGNLTASGVDSYVYTSENRLATFTKNGAVQSYLGYDGLGQLALVSPQVPTPKLDYLMVADGVPQFEFNSVTGMLRRHVHGPGSDEPLVTYEGAGTSDKRYLHADERGSIIAISNASGQVTQINAYDDYGIPQGKNAAGAALSGLTVTSSFGRFGYTGQAWLPEVGLYHYKARAYSPTLGRFMQTDPIGYGDGVNLYAYVGGDPVNGRDPSGLACVGFGCGSNETITGSRLGSQNGIPGGTGSGRSRGGGGGDIDSCNAFVANPEAISSKCLGSIEGGDRIGGDEPREEEKPSTLKKLGQCTADQLGLSTILGTELSKAGIPEPGSKRFVTEGSSSGTSRLSRELAERFPQRIGETTFGRITGIKSIPTPRLGQLGRATPVIGRAAGRLIPFVGAALLAYDAINIAICTAND